MRDGVRAVIGGMITDKTVKHTKTNQMMAFLTLEDLMGDCRGRCLPQGL